MSIIKILPENLINQIAAGEVVERPASVVKELVENSLDAGATEITIEVQDGGRDFIKITDNGVGMSREDAEIAIQRHSTSKIGKADDLWQIKTMGFRGEALASIASVSNMIIKTRQASDDFGTELQCKGGTVTTIKDVGMAPGTKIEVHSLFFNTPARQKYLKKTSTEIGHIISTVNTLGLANAGVAFKLLHNGKVVVDLPAVTDLLSRISDIFGSNTSEAMIPIFFGGSDFEIDGYIGKPLLSRSNSKHQYFLVNGRAIQHHLLARRIQDAFHSMLMENKKPIFVVNIKIDPKLIDVNVHPRKLEIRFEDQQTLMSAVYGAVKKALEKTDLMPKGYTESRRYMSDAFPKNDNKEVGQAPRNFGGRAPVFGGGFSSTRTIEGRPSSRGVQDALQFSASLMSQEAREELQSTGRKEAPVSSNDISELKVIAQVANSYIVTMGPEGLVLIDQHAAHEKVRFEFLMKQFASQEKSVQPLLIPMQVELTGDEMNLLSENMEIFEKMGFAIENFGGNTFLIQEVPSCFSKEEMDGVIRGVLDDLDEEKTPTHFQGKTEQIITYTSCRSAIKFGQRLSMEEMEVLIQQLSKLERPYTCPHGRPSMVSLTFSELEKMFGRK